MNKTKTLTLILVLLISFLLFSKSSDYFSNDLINASGETIETRFKLPKGYTRISYPENSFPTYLRGLTLKPSGSKVLLFDGRTKRSDVHSAVLNMDVGKADLQQCADACIRLRSEYLFREKRFDEIRFNFTNGWNAEYSKWRLGYRIRVKGNDCSWIKTSTAEDSYSAFRLYLDKVFAYSGTLSLTKELKKTSLKSIKPGDVFIYGGSPGHAVMVVDVAQNNMGEKIFMLAQSYMPAQEIHVLKNLNDEEMSPWYTLKEGERLRTPEWSFEDGSLKMFAN